MIGDSGAGSMVDGDGDLPGGCTVSFGAAMCPPDGVTMLILDLGDEDDFLDSSVSTATTVTGSLGAGHIRTGSGADDLDGGNGNDQLIGPFGADVFSGGPGLDQVRHEGHTQPIAQRSGARRARMARPRTAPPDSATTSKATTRASSAGRATTSWSATR